MGHYFLDRWYVYIKDTLGIVYRKMHNIKRFQIFNRVKDRIWNHIYIYVGSHMPKNTLFTA